MAGFHIPICIGFFVASTLHRNPTVPQLDSTKISQLYKIQYNDVDIQTVSYATEASPHSWPVISGR
jgi:hypothetical protein